MTSIADADVLAYLLLTLHTLQSRKFVCWQPHSKIYQDVGYSLNLLPQLVLAFILIYWFIVIINESSCYFCLERLLVLDTLYALMSNTKVVKEAMAKGIYCSVTVLCKIKTEICIRKLLCKPKKIKLLFHCINCRMKIQCTYRKFLHRNWCFLTDWVSLFFVSTFVFIHRCSHLFVGSVL